MPAHYGIAMIPDAHKNALNVAYALWMDEDPTQSENLSQPANASGSPEDPVERWFGGRLYSEGELAVIQHFASHIPAADWPVMGVSGLVTEQQAIDAATALYLMVGTADTYTTPLAAQTLESALGALGMKRVVEDV